MSRNYLVITPVRDEERYLHCTLESMLSQEIRPVKFVIVNDGSSDKTGEIADSFAADHDWINVIHRNDRGKRDSAGGEVDAFYAGLNSTSESQWDFIVKLDGDLSFEPNYFKRCIAKFDENKLLGMGGGECYDVIDGAPIKVPAPSYHIRGAVKMYLRKCWEDIGGIINRPGWDTIDELMANYHGWQTQTFADIPIMHLRPTGQSVGSWKNAVKNGLCNYIAGYHPLFMFLKCLRRLAYKPYFIAAGGLLAGFISGYTNSVKRVDDKAFIKYVQSQQMAALLGKPSLWNT